MKYKDLKDSPVKELELKTRELKAQLLGLRAKKSAGQLEKPHQLKALRSDIARLQTALCAKRNAAKAEAKAAAKAAPKTQKAEKAPKKSSNKKASK